MLRYKPIDCEKLVEIINAAGDIFFSFARNKLINFLIRILSILSKWELC